MPKRGFGPIVYAGQVMPWGKGAIAGDYAFLSGVDPRDAETGVCVNGIEAQTELELDRIKETLEECGASLTNVVKFIWYLSDRSLLGRFYGARDGWFKKNAPTLLEERDYASTLLIVGMADEKMLVEIECYAYLGD